jgi:(5-formylfuran-3-yl)methyl phosphate synthase
MQIPLKLLISPKNTDEAKEAVAGGADIIDVKNPVEGPLGANYPWIIKEIMAATPKNLEVSCTIGEAPNISGSMSLAAFGAASLGVDYVKVGLSNLKTADEAKVFLEKIVKSAKQSNPKIKVVATGYADAYRAGSVNPLLVPQIAHKAKADVAMLDTAVKDGKSTFDFLTMAQLEAFVKFSRDFGLKVALAGSLKKTDLPNILLLGVDIVGLRGAACTESDRLKGHITKERVKELVELIGKGR